MEIYFGLLQKKAKAGSASGVATTVGAVAVAGPRSDKVAKKKKQVQADVDAGGVATALVSISIGIVL